MIINLPLIKKLAAEWFEYQDFCNEIMLTSNIGYPSETSESRFEEDRGARGGCIGKTRVPSAALDRLRQNPYLRSTDEIMRLMPGEYRKALEKDYRRDAPKSGTPEYNAHRQNLKNVIIWWRGAVALQQRAA